MNRENLTTKFSERFKEACFSKFARLLFLSNSNKYIELNLYLFYSKVKCCFGSGWVLLLTTNALLELSGKLLKLTIPDKTTCHYKVVI